MKKFFLPLLLCISLYSVKAQQKQFEGVVVYDTKVVSKLPEVSDEAWKRYLFLNDIVTIYFRRGFYHHTSPSQDIYFNPEQQKVYYRYKGIDSLFYSDYLYDTSNKVIEVLKFKEMTLINNVKCNILKVETLWGVTTYAYSPALYIDPTIDKNNSGGRYDAYIEEAKALYLQMETEGRAYSYKQTATRIDPRTLDDSIFKLPDLPITKFSHTSIRTAPEFKGGLDGYKKFLLQNLNGNLGNKHIEIPEEEKSAMAVVKLIFVVTEEGKVTDVEVLNRRDVPLALAEEAIRVTSKIPRLKPAMMNGKKVPYVFANSITFVAER